MVSSKTLLFFCFGKNENSSSAAGRRLMTTGNKSPGTNSLSCSCMCHFFSLHVFIFFPGKVKRLKKATDGIDILCKWMLCSQKTSLSLKGWLEFHKITDILKSNYRCICGCCGFCDSLLDTCTASDVRFRAVGAPQGFCLITLVLLQHVFFCLFVFPDLGRFVVLGKKIWFCDSISPIVMKTPTRKKAATDG